MSESQEAQPKQRTAGERITDLENALMGMYQGLNNMNSDLMTIKEAIKLLGNKLDSVAKAAQISDETISKLMIENNVAELTQKVKELVDKGILQSSQEITESSFIVGQEVDDTGAVMNPRIQFTLGSLEADLQEKIKAGGIGTPIDLREGKLKFLVTEVYAIVAPQAPEAAPVSNDAASQSSSDAAPAQSESNQ